jgi:hypothetical protein
MRQRRRLPVVCLLACVLLAGLIGCDHEEYEIELAPQGASMHRFLTAKHVPLNGDSTFPAAKATALARIYPEQLETEDDRTVAFRGEFVEQMPNDIGGKGEYVVYETAFGNAYAYSEQFRGEDKPSLFLEAYFEWSDQTVDILKGWLETELGETAGWEKFESFLDTHVRSDLKDMGVYYFIAVNQLQVATGTEADEETLAEQLAFRMVQYFVAHDYITPEQVPGITRLFTMNEQDEAAIAGILVDIVRRKAEIDDEEFLTALHELFSDTKRLDVSLSDYVTVNVPMTGGDADEGDSTPTLPAPPIGMTFLPQDKLSLTLRLPHNANLVNANGQIDEDSGTVTWSSDLPDKDVAELLPVHCFAAWTVADTDAQTTHLGGTPLFGEKLLMYAMWRNSLAADEAAEWNAVIAALSPDDEASVAALRDFRFSNEPLEDAEGNPVDSDARGGIELLMSVID